jgi:phosphomannomutase
LEQWKKAGKIDGKQFIGTTIVSTPMLLELASAYNVECKVGLTGFKWIAKFIKDFPQLKFIGGGEESFGYMVGDAVRDKDAVSASAILCEMAAYEKNKGRSLFEKLVDLYVQYGFYKEDLLSITKKGMNGVAEINAMMESFRTNPPQSIIGIKVEKLFDYELKVGKNLLDGSSWEIDLPKSNVLQFELTDGTKISARPSGTEPKIKFYFSVNSTLSEASAFEIEEKKLDEKIAQIINALGLR